MNEEPIIKEKNYVSKILLTKFEMEVENLNGAEMRNIK
jgi:hypothetical protein